MENADDDHNIEADDLTQGQIKFRVWLTIESLLIPSYIVCTMLFTFISKLTKPEVRLVSPYVNTEASDTDFLEIWSLVLELILYSSFTPLFLCVVFLVYVQEQFGI